MQYSVVLEIFPNAPMVPPPQTSPNHIEPIEYIKIKFKTFSANGIGGGFYFKKKPLVPPGAKFIMNEKSGQQNL